MDAYRRSIEHARPNGYPDTYRTAIKYRNAKQRGNYYFDADLGDYRHFHADGSDHPFSVCVCYTDDKRGRYAVGLRTKRYASTNSE